MWGMCEMISDGEACDQVCMLLQYQVAVLACRGHVGKVGGKVGAGDVEMVGTDRGCCSAKAMEEPISHPWLPCHAPTQSQQTVLP